MRYRALIITEYAHRANEILLSKLVKTFDYIVRQEAKVSNYKLSFHVTMSFLKLWGEAVTLSDKLLILHIQITLRT